MRASRRGAALALSILLVACTGGGGPRAFHPSFRPTPCPRDVNLLLLVSHSCGFITVLEDRTRPQGPTIQVFVTRMDPPDDPLRQDPVIIVGGEVGGLPDYGGLQAAPQLLRRVVYVIDPRGSGHSRPSLSCPETETADDDRAAFLVAVSACRSRLVSAGTDPANFDLAATAADVGDLRRALGIDAWDLGASGTGAVIAIEVMRRYPDHLRAVFLDSPQLSVSRGADLAVGTSLVLRMIFKTCRARPACDRRYPALRDTWRRTIDRLQGQPIVVRSGGVELAFGADAFVRGLETYVAEDLASIPDVPKIVTAASHGRIDPDLLAAYRARVPLCAGYRAGCDQEGSLGAYLSALCPEGGVALSLPGRLRSVVRIPGVRRAFGSDPYEAACTEWADGATEPAVGDELVPAIPTLLVAGRFDPFSPPRSVPELSRSSLRGSFTLEVPTADHRPLFLSGCQVRIWSRWLNNPSSPPPRTACLARSEIDFTK